MGFLGRSISNEDYPIIWTRDPIIGILGLKKRRETKLVIEVHQNLSFLDKFALKALTLFAEVVIAPISLNLKEQLEKSKYKFDASKIEDFSLKKEMYSSLEEDSCDQKVSDLTSGSLSFMSKKIFIIALIKVSYKTHCSS